ncbi:MAG: family 10 glycosylhydrolase [Candidatus Bathyarchaeia archaeon]
MTVERAASRLTLFLVSMLTLMLITGHVKADLDFIFEGRGVWVWATSFSSDPNIGPLQMHEAFKNFSEIGLNFVLFLVKSSGGWLYYNSSIGPVDPNYNWDPLKVAVEAAHRFGLELHAWFCVFRDIKLAGERLEWAMVDVNGSISEEWVCPENDEVRGYMKSLIGEVAFKYDVDGIHLDYIRYPNRTYCYCNRCKENWVSEHPEISWPPPPTNPVWIEWRQKQITSFIEETHMMLKGINPKIKLSTAVFPVPEDAINNRMQNYPEWAEEGIIDFITPMTYINVPCQFGEWLKKILRAVKGKTLVYVGIGLYLLAEAPSPSDMLKEQINKTRYVTITTDCITISADGFVLFRYKYLDLFNETIRQLNAKPALPPHSEEFPPEISEPIREPVEAQPNQPVNITVNVTDYQTRVRNVTLWYKANNGTWWITTMKRTCQNTYHATIPGYEYCTNITYRIEACDIVGNKAIKDNEYHVVPEYSSTALYLLIIITISLAMIRHVK